MQSKIKNIKFKFLFIFATFSAILNLSGVYRAINQFLDFCRDFGNEVKLASDFFYFIAFAKTALVSSKAYTAVVPILKEYFCVENLSFGFSYPPNVLLLISHLGFIEKFMGFKAAVLSVYLFNFIFCILLALILKKLTKINGWLILLIVLSTNASLVALVSGQLSILFALATSTAIYLFIKDKKLLAGLLISIFSIKPQLALLIGLFVISQPRVLIGALLGQIISHGYALIHSGTDIYQSYFTSFVQGTDKASFFFSKLSVALPSIVVKNFHITDTKLITGIYLIFVISILVVLFKKLKTTKHIETKIGLIMICNILITPYMLLYDYFLMVPAVLLIAKNHYRDNVFLIAAFFTLYGTVNGISILGPFSDSWLFLLVLFLIITKRLD